jgi:ribosomal protein S18 acetylase RimI-like enzyme
METSTGSHKQPRIFDTPVGPVAIVQAQPEDLETVVSILEEAGRWLHGRGIDQWDAVLTPREKEHLAQRIAAGEVYLARRGAESLGTLRLQDSDVAVWGDTPGAAYYIHGFAVRRSAAGLGRALLCWAEAEDQAAGKQYLRLDCWGTNTALCHYYEAMGFKSRGQRDMRGWLCALYEKQV